tara:strand:+ start:1526 stop:2221 length:696 start_codon:yes stop_codon:yes gene_type:complete
MKIKLIIVLFFIPFFCYSQKDKDVAPSQNQLTQCDISSNENYIVRTTVTSKSKLDDPKFIDQLKELLISQISSFVSSELTINSSKKLNKKSKLETLTNINVVARGILNDPNIDYCEGIVIISINKKEYKSKQYDFFKVKLRLASNSLEHLLEIGYIDDRKFLKDKIEYYSFELNQLTAMLPLINMQTNEEKIFNRLINNFVVLENKKSEIKLMRKKKWNDLKENIKNKLNI